MQKLFMFAACCLAFIFVACSRESHPHAPPPPLPVETVIAVKKDLPYTLSYPAQAAGSLQVEVRAQVGGILQAKLYEEGAFVTQGAQLFQIDAAPFKAVLSRAEGNLAVAVALAENAQSTYARMSRLNRQNAISRQDYDAARAANETAKANVLVARAEVDSAQINLAYTSITAPISGIVGISKVDVGNLIAPGGVSLTYMVQIDPMYVNFSMPAGDFAALSRGVVSGEVSGDILSDVISVEIILAGGTPYPQKGRIIFFDSSQIPETSSINLRAEVSNPEHSRVLMPGSFVRVNILGINYQNQIVVPVTAVLKTPSGDIAYVVNQDNTLSARRVKGITLGNLYLVGSGLNEGDVVVDGGLIKVKDGMKVIPAAANAAPSPAPQVPEGHHALTGGNPSDKQGA